MKLSNVPNWFAWSSAPFGFGVTVFMTGIIVVLGVEMHGPLERAVAYIGSVLMICGTFFGLVMTIETAKRSNYKSSVAGFIIFIIAIALCVRLVPILLE